MLPRPGRVATRDLNPTTADSESLYLDVAQKCDALKWKSMCGFTLRIPRMAGPRRLLASSCRDDWRFAETTNFNISAIRQLDEIVQERRQCGEQEQ
jgi:hypothetical protein